MRASAADGGQFAVSDGYCESACTHWYYIFLAALFFYFVVSATSSAPERSAVLRCCATKSQRVIAITAQLCAAHVLGWRRSKTGR